MPRKCWKIPIMYLYYVKTWTDYCKVYALVILHHMYEYCMSMSLTLRMHMRQTKTMISTQDDITFFGLANPNVQTFICHDYILGGWWVGRSNFRARPRSPFLLGPSIFSGAMLVVNSSGDRKVPALYSNLEKQNHVQLCLTKFSKQNFPVFLLRKALNCPSISSSAKRNPAMLGQVLRGEGTI